MHAAGGTWRAIDGVRHPFGFPVRDGSVYRGCATAPPPACGPSLLRSFRFGWYVRGTCTGVALPLHRLPVIHRSYGASISRWHAVLQGFAFPLRAGDFQFAIAPPPACNPSLLRSFHFAMARRVTGVCLSASRRRFSIRCRSTACLWSYHPYGVPPVRAHLNKT